MFALVDVNNFYASCEQLWEPRLRNRPVVVLNTKGLPAYQARERSATMGVQSSSTTLQGEVP